ncbi:unnamed protein product [Rhizoctonia solani]|uniref:VWFA domain-containing protein n=1 Tax=Rhizoctonia solani TaxID=456999 RepID=A0A8H2WVF9_9AGAM|nr:unnamed protein product [Rhizoctonia solani]
MEVASKCIDSGWLLILNGPTHSGKTSLIRTIASLRGMDLQEFCMNPGTDAADLLGGFEHSNRELNLRSLLSHIDAFLGKILVSTGLLDGDLADLSRSLKHTLNAPRPEQAKSSLNILKEVRRRLPSLGAFEPTNLIAQIDSFVLEGTSSTGRFEWVDGPLVKAMKEGYWLVLDHCNLCSPAVLDRLNSLCETDGVLVLSERGTIDGEIPVIVPHPDFRLFMSLNPRYGELSRAMRNRGVEVTMASVESPVDAARIRQSARLLSSLEGSRDSPIEDITLVQLLRRGLVLKSLVHTAPETTPVLPGLVLAANDCQAFRMASALSALDQPIDLKEGTEEYDVARLLFVATSIPRDSWHVLPHYLDALGHKYLAELWTKLSAHCILKISDSLRTRIGTQRGVSPWFLFSQPVLPHLNTNLVTSALVPELHLESVLQESGWEAVVQAQALASVTPLTSIPPHDLLSVMDKSRLLWGGLGVSVNTPRYVRSIAPLVATLYATCQTSLNTPDILNNARTIDLVQKLCHYSKVLQHITNTPYADFAAIQAIIQLIGAVFGEPGSSATHFQKVAEMMERLMQEMQLKTGKEMLRLWSAMRQPGPVTQSAQEVVSSLFMGSLDTGTRRERLEVAAMICTQESPELIDCGNKLMAVENKTVAQPPDGNTLDLDHQEACLSIMSILSRALQGTSTNQLNTTFFAVACRVPSVDLQSLVFLRILLWDVEPPTTKSSDLPPLLEGSSLLPNGRRLHNVFASQLEWMRTCWPPSENEPSGPQSILMSIEYPACLARCDPCSVRLSSYDQYQERIRTQELRTKAQVHFMPNERLLSVVILWSHSISLIFASFRSELTEEEQSRFLRIQESLDHTIDNQAICRTILDLVLCLQECSCPLLAQVAEKHLSKLGDSFGLTVQQDLNVGAFIGETWIRSAYMLLELYFPDVAMDPQGGQDSQRRLWDTQADWLGLYAQVLEKGQQFSLGSDHEPMLRRLYDRACAARKQSDQLRPTVARGPEHLRQLTEMFAEAHMFLGQTIESSRIFQLIKSLRANVANTQAQEALVQQTTANFLQRLHQNYPSLSDIVAPVEYALQQLKLGLRLYASSVVHLRSNRLDIPATVQCLIQRPTNRAAQRILELDLTTVAPIAHLAVSNSEWILAQVSALLLLKDIHRTPRLALRPLVNLYNSFLELWLSQKTREAHAETQAQSLYKQNKQDSTGNSEEAEMEKDFHDLFPEFGDILDDTAPAAAHGTHEIARNVMSVTSKDIREIYRLHTTWAILQSHPQTTSSHISFTHTQLVGSLLARIVESYASSLDVSVDSEGFLRQLEILEASKARLKSTVTADFNFYKDYSILEMSKAARLLDGFRARLDSLVDEWPDQMVLRHLLERCQAIQQLRLDTPLAMVLSALEQLLLHTADWEVYANKDNSLKVQQQQLTDLIIDWRRLELKCWSTILDRELTSSIESVSSWWPRLYESIVSVVATLEGDSTKTSSHLEQLVPLLDSYLMQSPLGQFEARLLLLQSFATLTRQLSEDSIPANSFSRTSDIVESLCVQYFRLLPSIQESLKKQRASLDKDIGDFIKLASWKDTNVHALKQSAQKTHHVLYKCIRKFRDVIRQPGYAEGVGKRLVLNKGSGLIHDLATRIISEAKELAETVIPESEARERHIKALISKKRRAWSDLLKELKRLGLSGAATTDRLTQHQDRASLLSLYINPDHGRLFSQAISKSNIQFSRLLETLPEMRAALSHHHSDISTRDFQRACNLVESSFSHVIEARNILRPSLAAYDRVCGQLERLVDLRSLVAGGDAIAGVGKRFFNSVQLIQTTLAEIHASLVELGQDITRFDLVTDTSSIPATIKSLVDNSVTKSAEILAAASSLKERGALLGTPVWTQGEAKVFETARSFISDLTATFRVIGSDPSIPVRLFQPICDWLNALEAPAQPEHIAPSSNETSPFADEVISKLLTGMQTIVTNENLTMELVDEDEIPDKTIRIATAHTRKIASVLGIADVERAVEIFVDRMTSMTGGQIAYSIDRLTPFLQLYTNLVCKGLSETLSWLGSVSRLTLTLATTIQNLMQKGFCKPPDTQDEDDNGKGGQELTEGTGMGEGAGAENISNQIEDESQVEGLKGEDNSGAKGDKNDDDQDAIEMSEDFAGDMEDVSGDEDEDEDDNPKSGSEADPEERIDDLDSADPNVVDEKLWNNETADEKPEGQDQAGDDKNAQSGEQSETAAKEDKPQQSKEKPDPNEPEKATEDETEADEQEQGMEEQPEQSSDGRKMDDYVPEANTLDLPDEIDLGPDGDKEASDSEDETGDEDTVMGDAESVDDRDGNHEPDPTSQETADDATAVDQDLAADDAMSEDHQGEGEQQQDAGLGRQDAEGGNNQDTDASGLDDQRGAGAGQGKSNEGVDDQDGHDAGDEHAPETNLEVNENEPSDPATGKQGTQTRSHGASQRPEQRSNQELPNPLRSLGDASKEIQRRVDEILNRQDAQATRSDPTQDAGEVEYMQDDDEDQEMQALGPSNEVDETTKLRDLRIDETPRGIFQDDLTANLDMEIDAKPPPNDVKQESAKAQDHPLEAALTAEDVHRQGQGNEGDDQDEHDAGEEHAPETNLDRANENESTDPATGKQGAQTRSHGASQRPEQRSNQELPNPLRSLGDASKEIQRRVDEILNRQDTQATRSDPTQDPGEVEYMQDDDEDQEMQALGPSNEVDETTKLRDLRIDETPRGVSQEDPTNLDMEVDAGPPPNDMKQESVEARDHSLEAALTAEDVHRLHTERHDQHNAVTMAETSAKRQVEPEDDVPLDSTSVEKVAAGWQANGNPIQGAEEIWRLYENLTRDSSHALCEQLRLVLAPTRATRLRGDFRTGKRLNMKKLVPYVASDFTRDKIWLRRTRPAAREYQVLLAVDDSRSMARDSHTVHLTRQALALVARALEKLEVGELALARFGREMNVVHEFGAGVLQGGAALGQFTFNQPTTDVLQMIESSLDVLRAARERSTSSTSADLWQLEIVISDGICQDHERLRTVLRRAEEERVMVVFVVVDAPARDGNGSQDSSIVSMLQPTIKMVNGKMDIQMERYLDTFPFRYFVVLRDVDALPSVLAGTLRQFFERISED